MSSRVPCVGECVGGSMVCVRDRVLSGCLRLVPWVLYVCPYRIVDAEVMETCGLVGVVRTDEEY